MGVKMTRRTWLAALAAAPLAGAVLGWSERKRWQPGAPRELIRRHHFPDCELVTHEGRSVRFYTDLIRDKKVVVNFMYAHCRGICSPVTDNLVRVQRLLTPRVGRDIFFYSLTLEAAHDTPEELRHYAEDHRVGPGWLFLTGRPEDCETLRRKLGFIDPDPVLDADLTNHAGNILFGNEPLMLWAACPGQADPEWIAASILAEVDRGA
jgi:protein SCO1/2